MNPKKWLALCAGAYLWNTIQMCVVPNRCLVAPNSHLVSMWDAIGYCTGPTHFANSEKANPQFQIRIQIQCRLPSLLQYSTVGVACVRNSQPFRLRQNVKFGGGLVSCFLLRRPSNLFFVFTSRLSSSFFCSSRRHS